jgi:tetratricopeptide (TPR) repeat protein
MTAALLALALLSQPTDPVGVEDALRRAKNEYAYGNYEAAVDQLTGLLYPMRLSTDEQVIEARKYLALSYYLLDRLDQVGEEFAKLLHLDPDYQLDPYTVAPPVIEMFESIRRQLKPELDAIRQLKSDRKLEQPLQPGVQREIERVIIEKSELALYLPFGLGQFQNGDTGLGIAFAVSEALLLALNIGCWLYAVEGVGNNYPEEDRLLVQALTVTQYASLALFGLTWTLGVFHARLHFEPQAAGPETVREVPLATTGRLAPGLLFTLVF